MRVTQLCQNFHFWVNYPFKLRQTVTKDAFIPRFIPRSSHMRAQHWCCKMTQAVLLMAVCISVKALMSTPVSVSRCDDHDRDTSAVLYKRFQEQLGCTNLSFTLSLLYGYTPSLSRSELYYLCIFKCRLVHIFLAFKYKPSLNCFRFMLKNRKLHYTTKYLASVWFIFLILLTSKNAFN